MKMKREDGFLVNSKMIGVQKGHFEHLMNKETGGKATVLTMGMKAGGNGVF